MLCTSVTFLEDKKCNQKERCLCLLSGVLNIVIKTSEDQMIDFFEFFKQQSMTGVRCSEPDVFQQPGAPSWRGQLL
jgi:hypothetical protein